MANAKEIGSIVKQRRQAMKVNQQDLADLAGVGLNERRVLHKMIPREV